MAERLTEPPTRTVPLRYPWHEWTDGSWWRIHRGEDYTCTTKSMEVQLYRQGAPLGSQQRRRVEIVVAPDGESIAFRFHPPTGP